MRVAQLDNFFEQRKTLILGGLGVGVVAVLYLQHHGTHSLPSGLPQAIDNSSLPSGAGYQGGGAVVITPSNADANSSAQQFQQAQQLQEQQFQQQLQLLQAQTQSQIQLQNAQTQAQLAINKSGADAQNSVLAHAAQARNNPFAGCQGLGCVGSGIGAAIKVFSLGLF